MVRESTTVPNGSGELTAGVSRSTLSVLGSDLSVWRYSSAAVLPEGYEQDHPAASGNGDEARDSCSRLIMLHGLRGTHHGLGLIAGSLPEREVLIPDLPGFGDSGPMTAGRHDVAGYARAVVELLRELRSDGERFDLLGHSFGAVVTAAVAARAPELVRRMVLVNPIAVSPAHGASSVLTRITSAYYRLGELLPGRLGRALLSNRWIVLAATRVMLRTRDSRVRRFVYDSHLRHFSRFHSPALVVESYRSSLTASVEDHVERVQAPTLLIAGATDEIAPLDGQRRLVGRFADGRLRVLDEVGHLVHYEAPERVAREVRSFLDES
ncbi:Pimeloyl-ACP methyl ester carboxylesterase [Actinopolyspora saharensis]|uniref:Pimeloyl-ACP methyl ester carboxylesterase n=1 Tax=Actinopolyspora saharensis TaxID=995062 RepID=A0A1H1EQ48_9ACTN|nr:Pimeloyl-ACP methyl ester carboxylesterase [Actinopolyspora saharensis]